MAFGSAMSPLPFLLLTWEAGGREEVGCLASLPLSPASAGTCSGARGAPFLTAPFLLINRALPFRTVAWSAAFEGWAWYPGGEAH